MKNERGPLGRAAYGFESGTDACVIYDPRTPRYWYNYLWNDLGFCTQISQTGHGRSFFLNEKAQMCMLNRDQARYLYIRDETDGGCFCPGLAPLDEPVDKYRCTHVLTFSQIESERNGIRASWKIFVPQRILGECWAVTLKNISEKPKLISLFSLVSFSLDGFTHPRYYEMYRCIETAYDNALHGIFCRSAHPFAPHDFYNGFLASSEPTFAWDGDLTAFCGTLGTITQTDGASSALYQRPELLLSGKNCTDSDAALFIPGAVLQHKITLLPGESRTIRYVYGLSRTIKEAEECAAYYTDAVNAEDAFRETVKVYAGRFRSLSVTTPDEQINHIMNIWIQKQTAFCIVGKKGVRDNLQIAAAMLNFWPQKAKAEIMECLQHQFHDGHTVLTWYPYDDTRYSDQPFWIIWAVCELIRETGDCSILQQETAWQDGGTGTVLEHVEAAVRCLLQDTGNNGLVRIRFADWNDALNIPPEESGESVMLSEQLCLALKELQKLMLWNGNKEYAEKLRRESDTMRDAINRSAWDGGWYCRALTKAGKIGSKDSAGSKVYLNAQTWAVLGDVVPTDRLRALLNAVDRMECDFGFPLNNPPYQKYDPLIGRISGMLPGLFENGGVYCHASAFKILMDCKLGRGDDALRTLKKIMPDSALNPSARSGAEPYVFSNCYSIHPKYYGRSYQSWTTGTSAWVLKGLYEGILGVRADYEGLRVAPAFPSEWNKARMTRSFRGAEYCFTYQRTGKFSLSADGKSIRGNLIPDFHDEKKHLIRVEI